MSDSVTKSFKFHSKGLITLTNDVSGLNKEVYSCGVDDSVGLWKQSEDDDNLDYDAHNCLNKCQSVIAVVEDDIYVGEVTQNPVTKSDQQVVVKYEKEGFESSAPLLSFSLEVTALALSRDGQYLIAGSNDFLVKCLHLKNPEKGYDRYECNSLVVNVSIDPKCIFFSISTADGNVQFRTIEKSKVSIAQFKSCSSFSHITCETPRIQVVWQMRGNFAFIPATGGVMVIDCMKWTKDRLLNLPETSHETFSVASISCDDEFLASCTIQGTLVVWKIDNLKPFCTRSIKISPSIVTSIVFSLLDTTSIIAAYSEGYLGTIKNIKSTNADFSSLPRALSLNEPRLSKTSLKSSVGEDEKNPTVKKTRRRIDSDESDFSLNDEDNTTTSQGITNKANETATGVDLPVIFDDDDPEVDLGLIKSQFGFNQDGVFVGNSSCNEQSFSNAKLTDGISTSNASGFTNTMQKLDPNFAAIGDGRPCTTIKRMKIPKMFIAGSTPFSQSQRYLMWNTFGTICNFRSADDSTIEISFHDATIHSEIVIDNTAENYVFGDLNPHLIALASQSTSDLESKLYVQQISSWDVDSREWTTKLSSSEDIDALCVGANFVAVFTSLRFIRIFSAAGTQRIIVSFPGPLLTVCAWENSLIFVRPTGGVVITAEDNYEHQLVAEVYEVNALSSVRSIYHSKSLPLCLGADAHLDWIAFSNAGRLVTMDSDCTLRLYSNVNDVWTPIIIGVDLLKNVENDNLWPIALLEKPTPSFRYVYCQNSKYPLASKSIIPTTIPWNIPVLEANLERSKLESQLMVNEMMQSLLRQGQHPEKSSLNELTQSYVANLVKLFALSFNVGREYRAVEFAHLTSTSQAIQVMCNYAAKKERPNLSEKIAAIGRERILAEEKAKNMAVPSHISTTTSSMHLTTFKSSTTVDDTKTENRLAPNPIRLKRKLNVDEQKTSNQTKSNNPFAAKNKTTENHDLFSEPLQSSVCRQLKECVTPSSVVLEESLLTSSMIDDDDLSQKSSLFDCSLNFDVNTSNMISAKNPFKRCRVNNSANEDDSPWSEGTDFFDQLSKGKKSKRADVANSKENNTAKGGRQSKLSFGSVAKTNLNNPLSDIAPILEFPNNENSNNVPKKRTGFDLWCEENNAQLLKSFSGDSSDSQLYFIQQFRSLSSDEKKKWNEKAKQC